MRTDQGLIRIGRKGVRYDDGGTQINTEAEVRGRPRHVTTAEKGGDCHHEISWTNDCDGTKTGSRDGDRISSRARRGPPQTLKLQTHQPRDAICCDLMGGTAADGNHQALRRRPRIGDCRRISTPINTCPYACSRAPHLISACTPGAGRGISRREQHARLRSLEVQD